MRGDMRPFTSQSATVAWAAAAAGIGYGITFAVLGNVTAASIILTTGAVLTVLIISAIGASVDDTPAVRLAMMVGTIGGLASATHGIYDLANQIHPPAVVAPTDLPNAIDPRGFATFALVGAALVVLGGPIGRHPRYGSGIGIAARVLGSISVGIFLVRLIILDPTNPVVRVALLAGVVANTVFAVGLGRRWSTPVGSSDRAALVRAS